MLLASIIIRRDRALTVQSYCLVRLRVLDGGETIHWTVGDGWTITVGFPNNIAFDFLVSQLAYHPSLARLLLILLHPFSGSESGIPEKCIGKENP